MGQNGDVRAKNDADDSDDDDWQEKMTWHFVDRGFVPGIQACAYVSLFTVTEPGRTGREIWDMGHLDIVHGGGYAEE